MKLFIASLIAISLVPLASAGGVDAFVGSSGYGNCETDQYAFQDNTAQAVAAVGGVGYAFVDAGTYCYAYYDWFSGQTYRGREVTAVAAACVDAASICAGGAAYWFSGGNYCDTVVLTPLGWQSLGCPAGAPPVVNAIIP